MAYAAQALQAAALVLLTYIVTSIYQSYRSSIDFQAFARANNCQPPVFSPSYLPWGLDRIYKILTSKGCDFVDDFIFARFKSQGRWTVISTAFGGSFTVRHLEIYTALRAEVLPTFGPDPSSSSSPPTPPHHTANAQTPPSPAAHPPRNPASAPASPPQQPHRSPPHLLACGHRRRLFELRGAAAAGYLGRRRGGMESAAVGAGGGDGGGTGGLREGPGNRGEGKGTQTERRLKSMCSGEFFPFNMGPRVCMGMGWAMAGAGWAVVGIAQRVERIEAVGEEGRGKMRAVGLTMAREGGVKVRLRWAAEGGVAARV